MATVYSVQKTKWDQNEPAENIQANEQVGRVRIAYATYELSSTASGTVVEMFNLPDGARVLDGYLLYDALGASSTVSVGHTAYNNADGTSVALDVDEFLAATSTASAGRTDVAATLALGAMTEIDADKTGMPITCVTGGATTTGTVSLCMRYVVD